MLAELINSLKMEKVIKASKAKGALRIIRGRPVGNNRSSPDYPYPLSCLYYIRYSVAFPKLAALCKMALEYLAPVLCRTKYIPYVWAYYHAIFSGATP